MDADLRSMTGQKSEGRVKAYKLNEVTMHGTTGEFLMKEILGEKGADGKYKKLNLGKSIDGVILKMRWRLAKFQKAPARSMLTSEYDNKNKDTVVEFSSGEKATAITLKERHGLGAQRVLYVFIPKQQQVVRVIVKPTGLASDDKEVMGLFEYVDVYESTDTDIHASMTHLEGIELKGDLGSYYAMRFKAGRALNDTELAKCVGLIKEIYQNTTATAVEFVAGYEGKTPEEATAAGIDYPKDEINPDDIPF